MSLISLLLDLYTLGVIEAKKSKVGFFEKEKLKAKSMGVLKPYNVKFMDLGDLLSEIEKQSYHNNQGLVDKYGEVDLDSKASSAGLKYVLPILVGVVVFFYIFNTSSSDTSSSTSKSSSTSNSSNKDTSLEESKRAYNLGYDDGQMAYGLPASQRASAFEVHMVKGYNFSKIDYLVYKMGYDDAQYGRKRK